MHSENLSQWKHDHNTHSDNREAERNTHRVMWLTLCMMFIEITAGWLTGSMALLADGWHMGTHFFALGITAFAYWFSRKHANDISYSFGTGKVDVLGGYTSAIVLIIVALIMAAESIARIISPGTIHFNEALMVAVIGLIVNLVSAFMLGGHNHSHGHAHGDKHHSHSGHHHQDHNLRAAYLHVLADALTSVFAITALLVGKYMGWLWLDPVVGILGACVITQWGVGLMRDTSRILLDRDGDEAIRKQVQQLIEADSDNRVADIHLWCIGSGRFALILSIVTHFPREPEHYKALLRDLPDLVHLTVEIHNSPGEPCIEPLS